MAPFVGRGMSIFVTTSVKEVVFDVGSHSRFVDLLQAACGYEEGFEEFQVDVDSSIHWKTRLLIPAISQNRNLLSAAFAIHEQRLT